MGKHALSTLRKTATVVSSAAAQRAEHLLELIGRRQQRIAEDFYDIGEALIELSKKKLYAALGYASFGDLLDARKVMSRSQAAKLVEIVTALPRHEALVVGEEKAYALVRLAAATPEVDDARTLLERGTIRVGGKQVPIARTSVRDLTRAAQEARRTAAKQRTPTPAESERAASEREAKAAQARLRREGLRGAIVEARKTRGVWWARVTVRLGDVGTLRGKPR